jgi:hypothetical protein
LHALLLSARSKWDSIVVAALVETGAVLSLHKASTEREENAEVGFDEELARKYNLDEEYFGFLQQMIGVLKTQYGKKKPWSGQPVSSVPAERTKTILAGLTTDDQLVLIVRFLKMALSPICVFPATAGGSFAAAAAFVNRPSATHVDVDIKSKDTTYGPTTCALPAAYMEVICPFAADILFEGIKADLVNLTVMRIVGAGLKVLVSGAFLSGLKITLDVNSITTFSTVRTCFVFEDCKAQEASITTTLHGTIIYMRVRNGVLMFALSTGDDLAMAVEGYTCAAQVESETAPYLLKWLAACMIGTKNIVRSANEHVFCHEFMRAGLHCYDPVRAFTKVMEKPFNVQRGRGPAVKPDELRSFLDSILARCPPSEMISLCDMAMQEYAWLGKEGTLLELIVQQLMALSHMSVSFFASQLLEKVVKRPMWELEILSLTDI